MQSLILKGDSFYIFSDGYVDQFGGEKGKKYKSAPFKKYLLSINHETMDKQKELIENHFSLKCGVLNTKEIIFLKSLFKKFEICPSGSTTLCL